MSYTVKDVLDQLFMNADQLMTELAAKNGGQFTSPQFVKAVAQRNQEVYIELLNRCLAHPSASPFNAAHQHIGHRLSSEARKAGYEGPVNEGRTETDIFNQPTDRMVYRRKA